MKKIRVGQLQKQKDKNLVGKDPEIDDGKNKNLASILMWKL